MECHRIFPDTPAAGIIGDRDDLEAVDTVLDIRLVAGSDLVAGAMSPRLSAIVLGPLIIVVE